MLINAFYVNEKNERSGSFRELAGNPAACFYIRLSSRRNLFVVRNKVFLVLNRRTAGAQNGSNGEATRSIGIRYGGERKG